VTRKFSTVPHSACGDILRQLAVLFAVVPTAADWRDRVVWDSRSQTTQPTSLVTTERERTP
jgi:hypothetical protein